MPQDIVGKAINGASYLVLVQVLSRLFTFLLNVGLTRYMNDPAAFGIASIQLYLLYTTSLTLSREGLRRSCLRTSADKDGRIPVRSMVNLVWRFILPGILILTPILCIVFVAYPDASSLDKVPVHDYEYSVALVGVSVALELMTEPMFVVAQAQLKYSTRAYIEAVAVLLRCVVTLLCTILADFHLVSFAYGHVAYGLALLVCYALHFSRNLDKQVSSLGQFLPTNGLEVSHPDLWTVAVGSSKQTVWKLVLTEGEKMVMFGMGAGAVEQGVYALVSNLGSLVARFAFQPIEEIAYTIFGKMNDYAKKDTKARQGEAPVQEYLVMFMKFMSIIGFVFVAFGTQFSHLLLHMLYGSKWTTNTDAPVALSAYCVYVLVIAINGISEAFVNAVGDRAAMETFNWWLVVCSVVYLSSAALLLRFGVVGLICANTINMFLRIAFSVRFILVYNAASGKRKLGFWELMPSRGTMVGFVVALVVNGQSARHLYLEYKSHSHAATHLGVGIGMFVLVGVVVFIQERTLLENIRRLTRSRADKLE